jgi:hypothetical protein
VQVTDPRLPDLEIWLARLGGLSRLINRRPGHGLAPATGEGGSLAVVSSTGDAFAYLTYRPAEGSGGDTTRELGIYAYGPHGDLLADRVTGRVRAWAAEQPNRTTSIEIYPLDACVPSPEEVLLTVAKEHIQVVARTAVGADRQRTDSRAVGCRTVPAADPGTGPGATRGIGTAPVPEGDRPRTPTMLYKL